MVSIKNRMLLPCYWTALAYHSSYLKNPAVVSLISLIGFITITPLGPTRQIQFKGFLHSAPKIFIHLDQHSIEFFTSQN